MSVYRFVLFIHICAAVLLLATSIVGEPGVRSAVRRATDVREIRALLNLGGWLSRISPVAAFAVLLSGLYLTNVTRMWSLGWVQVALVVWLINSATAIAIVRPTIDRVARQALDETDSSISATLNQLRSSRRWSLGVDLVAANDVATLYLMVLRPALAASVLAVVVANAAAIGARLLLARVGARRSPAERASVVS